MPRSLRTSGEGLRMPTGNLGKRGAVKKVDREYLVPPNKRHGLATDKPTYRMSLPRIRFGARFVRLTSFIIPALIVVVILVVGARVLVGTGTFQRFSADNPCLLPSDEQFGFPAWLRAMHWFNVLLMAIILKSGLQILADHPRLYGSIHSTPGKEWLRFRGPVPKEGLWTALDDSSHLSPALGLPGGRHTSGMARHWHFLSAPLWLLMGAAFIVLLFATGQWRQIIPTTMEFVPSSINCAVTYAGLQLPAGEAASGGTYNSLQMITYAFVVFIAAPLAILTGLAMSPTIAHRFAWYPRLFGNRQIARSVHFFIWAFFVVFVVAHVALVIWTGFTRNMNHIVLDNEGDSWTGAVIGIGIVVVILLLLVAANRFSWAHPRKVQHTFQKVASWVNGWLFNRMDPRVHWPESMISPFMWYNGAAPNSPEYQALLESDFADWELVVEGEVNNPRSFTLDQIKALPKHTQVTEQDCVQGWSGIAKWGGVPVREILKLVEPKPDARYIVFYAYEQPGAPYEFYDVHDLKHMDAVDSLLAYEMNDEKLPLLHGAPLRLRNERELGFKQVKWLKRISLEADYRHIHQGEGGFREDNEYQARSSEI